MIDRLPGFTTSNNDACSRKCASRSLKRRRFTDPLTVTCAPRAS